MRVECRHIKRIIYSLNGVSQNFLDNVPRQHLWDSIQNCEHMIRICRGSTTCSQDDIMVHSNERSMSTRRREEIWRNFATVSVDTPLILSSKSSAFKLFFLTYLYCRKVLRTTRDSSVKGGAG